MKNFKKTLAGLIAICMLVAVCNISCIALAEETVPVTAITVVGANYTLPAKVNDKAVEWTADAVNTSVAGSHYYTGTDSDGATVNLTLKVMETETIFSDDMESYEAGSSATRPSLVDGKGLSLAAYNASTNNAYIESVSGTKAVKISPKSAWTNKFVIGEEAYTGDFEANMKLKVINRQGATNYDLLQVRMSADNSYFTNVIGGFYLRNVRNTAVYGTQEIDEIFVAGYDGTSSAISSTKLTNINTEIITENNEEIGYNTEWINIKLVYNSSALSYDIYVNNQLVIENLKIDEEALKNSNTTTTASPITAIRAISFADRNTSGDVSTYIDNVTVNKLVDTQAYKTIIYEDMEKFAADTDDTAGTAARPVLIRAKTEAITATAGLVFAGFNSTSNDIYIKNVDGNNVSYLNGKTNFDNYLALPQAVTSTFDVTAKVKFDVESTSVTNLLYLLAHNGAAGHSAGGIRFTYNGNKLLAVTTTQNGNKAKDSTGVVQKNVESYIDITSTAEGRQVSDWIDFKLSFSSKVDSETQKTIWYYDVYLNDSKVFSEVPVYNNEDGTSDLALSVDQIKFVCQSADGKAISMVDDIKVTVPNSSTEAKQLLVAGDSIAAGTANAQVEGWANVIGKRLQNIEVNSNAKDGQCTNSFYKNSFYKNSPDENGVSINRFDELMWEANPGDVLVLSFGHNDRSRVAGTAENKETYTMADYKKYLVNCINKAKAYRVSTILATSVAEPIFVDGELSEINTSSKYTENTQVKDFAEAMREVAREENVPLIDLNAKTKTLLSTIGEDSAKNYYYSDKTHLLVRGAKTVAKYLTDGFAVTVLAPYVKKELNDGGIVVSASLANGVSIVNNDEVNYDGAKIIKAEFNGSSITDAEIIDAPLASGGIFEKAIEVADGNTAKIFLFENLDTIVPLANPVNAN